MRDCPKCGERTEVIDARVYDKYMRRRRKCECGHRFSTIEVPIDKETRFDSERLKEQLDWLFCPDEE